MVFASIDDESRFPERPSFPGFAEGMGLNRNTSPLTEGPFKMNLTDTKSAYLGSADVYPTQLGEVVAENNVSFNFIQEMIAFLDKDADGNLDEEDTVLFRYDVKILVSKDASYLKEAYDKMQPDDNDVCFFLEDNSTDLFSDRKAYIKIGSALQTDLKKQQIATIETKDAFITRYTTYSSNGATYPLDFTSDDLQQLITKGEIENPEMTLIIALYQALNIQVVLLGPLSGILAEALLWISKTARETIEFSEASWNPYASGKEDENFKPVLFGNISTLLELGAEAISTAKSGVEAGIKGQIELLRSKMSMLTNPSVEEYIGSDQLTQFFERVLGFAESSSSVLLNGLEAMLDFFFAFGDKWLNMCNAFYCGLWNGIVEIVLGLIDLVGYLFKAIEMAGSAVANAQTLIPQALEMADEFIQTVMDTDILDLVQSVFWKLMEKLQNFNLYALTQSVSVEQVAYFLGNVGGFVVELIIDAYFTGGTKAVADLLKKFGTASEKTLSVITGFITKITKGAVEFSIEAVFNSMKYFIEMLKSGKETILKWIDDFFKLLEDAAKLGVEFISKIKEFFGISDSQLSKLQEAGYYFVKAAETGGNFECSLCYVSKS
ncbi:MAG: hypothetical protein QM534_08440 [Sediminibacterium sp.]|nr:hypothetical protein [Sediminibacterium sp.]